MAESELSKTSRKAAWLREDIKNLNNSIAVLKKAIDKPELRGSHTLDEIQHHIQEYELLEAEKSKALQLLGETKKTK